MTFDTGVLEMARALASHASNRQSVVAGNVANADTPGYKAKAIAPFAETYSQTPSDFSLRSTRPGHQPSPYAETSRFAVFEAGGEVAPNGNSVSLEQEMVNAAEVRNQYDLALTVFSKSIDILRTSLGRR